MTATRLKERIGKAVFAAAAVICVIAVVAIFAFLIYKSIPAFGKLGVFRFMFGDNWSPDRLDTYDSPLSGTYGILTMIVGTLTATVGALLVGGVLLIDPDPITDLIGLLLIAIPFISQIVQSRKAKAAPAE